MSEFIEGAFVYGDDIYVDDAYMDEKWAFIPGVPGYMVSDKGRVWSERSRKFLKVKPMDSHGHLGVAMSCSGKPVYRYIHRLVAEAFIPNPNKLPVVRHIYDQPAFNCDDDVAWGTQKDNIHDSIANGRAYTLTDDDREKGFALTRTPIRAVDTTTGDTYIFKGQYEASRALGVPQPNIWKVLNGRRSRVSGYYFEYIERGGALNG